MAPDPISVERVYQGLKQEILSGAYALGGRIDIQAIADHFGTSVTPVRDAAQRLIGEGILEAQPHGGFQARIMTAQYLLDLYDWNAQLAQLASKMPARWHEPLGGLLADAETNNDQDRHAATTAQLFLLLAERSGIHAHRRTVARLNDALWAARVAEPLVIKDTSGELNRLVRTLDSHRRKAISDRLAAYHQRRRQQILEIVGMVHSFRHVINNK